MTDTPDTHETNDRTTYVTRLAITIPDYLDLADVQEVLKENLENFQYAFGVKLVDVSMSDLKPLRINLDLPFEVFAAKLRKAVIDQL